jgi:hypothetical protein
MATMSLPDPGPPNLEFERPARFAGQELEAALEATTGWRFVV